MNVIIPAAGHGRRFAEAGYEKPKPFIQIHGKPMIQHVIDNVSTSEDKVFVLMRTDHLAYVKDTELTKRDNISFILIDQVTEGATCTVLKARGFINNKEPLLIANSDQYIEYDVVDWRSMIKWHDGAIMTFPATDTKWSYAAVDERNRVTQVAEKSVISEHATCGLYYFGTGALFVEGAKKMMDKNIRVNSEFYIAPVFNEIVSQNDIRIFPVDAMYGLGTPEDLGTNAWRLK